MRLIILGGEKQSGKDTSANFIAGTILALAKKIESYKINKGGKLVANGALINSDEELNAIAPGLVYKTVFAYSLKDFCADHFNIPRNLVYGSDQDKATLTDIEWDNFPGCCTNLRLFQKISKISKNAPLFYHPPGKMSIREILQYFGTEVVRKMYSPAWVEATYQRLLRSNAHFGIVSDCRFPNELELASKFDKSLSVYLARPNDGDSHASERSLNPLLCDHIIDNTGKRTALYQKLLDCLKNSKILE